MASTTTAHRSVRDITEADVLEAAVEQLSQRKGYTADTYFRTTAGTETGNPGANVAACCAIGGVEQAIWKLTGQVVSDERQIAYGSRPSNRRVINRLYWKVMNRLNAVALRRHPRLLHAGGCSIEQLTFVAPKHKVVAAFREALEEARGEQ